MKSSGLAKAFVLVHLTLTSAATIAQLPSSPPSAPPTSLPQLDLLLKLNSTQGQVKDLVVTLSIGQPQVKANGILLRMPLIVASIPTARYNGDAIKARDKGGELTLTQKDEEPTPSGVYRQWLVTRDTVGDVVVTYRAPMRLVSASTRPGPLFDLRAESGGLNGAGLTFLAVPNGETKFNIRVHWDLGNMPQGSRGVWSFGEGVASAVGTAEVLANTYYAAGFLKSFPSDPASNYAMYWFGDPPFDPALVSRNIQKFYNFVSGFFHDQDSTYRVFVRKNPYKSGGGTTLIRSFMFGYNEYGRQTPAQLQGLLAHEIVHNWVALEGEHGATAWYSEGAAEYYSILLSERAGVYDKAEFLEMINSRALGYYTNELQSLSNDEAAEKFWSDSRAQRVPYGRGFMYLAQVDAEVRTKSGGKRSLDDLILAIYDRKIRGEKYGIPEWTDLVTKELGPKAEEEFDAMVKGTWLVPPVDSLVPCFAPEKSEATLFDLGFDIQSLTSSDRKVRGLVKESVAAAAGVREGDIVLDSSTFGDAQDRPGELLHLKLRRGEEELTISYVPRGKRVPSYQWKRVAGVADSSCKL